MSSGHYDIIPANMIEIKPFTCNFIEENCYVVSDESGEAVIIDCGAFFPEDKTRISDYIAEKALKPVRHLCTHGHFDHVFGAQYCADTFGLSPELSAAEQTTYAAAADQMRAFLHRDFPLSLPTAATPFNDGDTLSFGTHSLRVIATPGHTPGGVCFYCEAEGVLFSGDSLFCREVGRTDLPGGDEANLISALQRLVTTLPESVKVYPGHGPATTIGDERLFNRYIR